MNIIGTNDGKFDIVLLFRDILDQMLEIVVVAGNENGRYIVGIPDSTAFSTSCPFRLYNNENKERLVTAK